MGTPEGKPHTIDVNSLDRLPEKKQPGWGVKKPEAPTQQPATPSHGLTEFYGREQERYSGVLENPIRVPRPLPGNPSEQRGEQQPFQPNPAEQQAKERLGKPPSEEEGEVVETLDPEVEEMIRHAAMGDPEKEAHLLESAKKNRSLRDFFKHGPTSLTYDLPFPVQESEDTK